MGRAVSAVMAHHEGRLGLIRCLAQSNACHRRRFRPTSGRALSRS
jgi:hypothetical protein